ncbi:RAMP superfamily CRISPR-associated protein [Desulfonema magnum]|uniref:CRISPR type III-associated RAMP domain-containing protein n=1 Tax=Desulfonema magnum TaxID=45655 RepID=A0A975BVH9_9BACT|nr:RAMP superfamily CRISPR-associated protein [Desulfonema magnum]QTA92058.1 CRISPR type III-associated RAMP domain-containing protein [Desulfonema magnum]
MRHNLRLDMTISFESKWHTGSGESGFLVDRLISRDARGWPYIPGSTLKGVIRENCEKLSRTLGFPHPLDPHENDEFSEAFAPLNTLASPVDRIFGNKYESGNLFFRDARFKDEPPYRFLREQSRICCYRKLRTAKDKHLFSTQYAAPIKFETRIDGYHNDLVCLGENDPPYAYCLLIAAIMMTGRIGGDKSTGSGRIEISFNRIECNGKTLSEETVFEYLDSDLYEMTKEEEV